MICSDNGIFDYDICMSSQSYFPVHDICKKKRGCLHSVVTEMKDRIQGKYRHMDRWSTTVEGSVYCNDLERNEKKATEDKGSRGHER